MTKSRARDVASSEADEVYPVLRDVPEKVARAAHERSEAGERDGSASTALRQQARAARTGMVHAARTRCGGA
ncbi:MAG: hypothetical protein H6825_00015 [Planctomycetes bacterium]|nr:hypothetical protein [Planctomycetota bacterium]